MTNLKLKAWRKARREGRRLKLLYLVREEVREPLLVFSIKVAVGM